MHEERLGWFDRERASLLQLTSDSERHIADSRPRQPLPWSAICGSRANGWTMGPVLWWWRWWTGDDPTRDRQLVEARELLDEQRTRSADLTERLQALDTELAGARAEADQLGAYRSELEQTTRALEQTRSEAEQLRARVAELEAQLAAEESAPQPVDVSGAAEVLGTKIKVDDLTVVDGIGPKIASLLAEAGIDTWRALGAADVERLRDVLAQAGARYRVHDPSRWPSQAELLAEGRWDEFADLTSG
jgi:predicted flap endonuclease-1-like 5' DNA nuclease